MRDLSIESIFLGLLFWSKMDETSTNYVPQLGIMPTWDGFRHVNRPAISLD
jgi:hypothetical protein